MKRTFTLLLMCFTVLVSAQNPSDMIRSGIQKNRDEILKPALSVYVDQSKELIGKIKSSSSKKEISLYADQLQTLSIEFNKAVAELYGYQRRTEMDIVIIPLGNGDAAVAPVTHTVKTGTKPPVRDILSEITERSSWLSCFRGNHLEKVSKIEALVQSL